MNKLFTLLACALLYCSVNAKAPSSIVVQTKEDMVETFVLTKNTKFKFADKEICIIYPEGEYTIGYENLNKIEYSDVSNVYQVDNEPSYRFVGNKLTIDAATKDIDICLFSLSGETVYLRKIKISESAIIDFSIFKGIYILKINGINHKLSLK